VSRLVALFVAFAMALVAALARGQPAPSPVDSSLYIETDREALGLLGAARKAAADRDWRKAIELYQRLADYQGKDGTQPLVPADQGRRVFLPVQEVAAAELARLPEEALRRYRDAHDDAARSLFRKGIEARDAALLGAVARRYLASSWGDDALAALGAMAFERGDCVGALAAWQRLVALCPQPDVPLLSIRARMWVCRRLLGQRRAAEELARKLANDGAKRVATGSEMTVADLLASAPAPMRPTPLRQWPALAGANDGARPGAAIAQVGEPLWRRPLPNPQLDARELALCRHKGFLPPLNVHATARGRMVFVADQTTVFALAASTGELAWAFPEKAVPWLAGPFADTPHAVACARGAAVARLGDQVVALEAATGRLLWRRNLRPPEAGGEGKKAHSLGSKVRVLVSSPVVADGRVVVGVAELGEEARASVVALDLATGHTLWRTFVCSRTIPAFLGLGAVPSTPAVEGSTVYFLSNLGTVAAIGLRSGTIRWLHRYPSLVAQLRRSSIERERRWANNPPLVTNGLVVVAPQDGWQLLAIDAVDGGLRWAAPRAGSRYVVGVADGKVFAVGNGAAALDALTGRLAWTVALPGRAVARPALCPSALLVPTDKALLAVGTADGSLTVQRLWRDDEAPGNLTLADGRLLVVSAADVAAFGDWQDQAKALAGSGEADALLVRGRHEANRGNYKAAVALLEKAARAGKAEEARGELFRCYMALGRRGDEAALKKALAVADDPARKAEALRVLARLREESGRPGEAVAAWRQLLETVPLTSCRLDGGIEVSSRSLAAAEIARLVERHSTGLLPGGPTGALAKALAPAKAPTGPPTTRLWNVHTRIAHRLVEVVEVPGAPQGLVVLAAQRRTFDRPAVFNSLECRDAATGELLWEREVGEWNELAVVAAGKLVVATPRRVMALEPRSGAAAWAYATAAPERARAPSLRRPGMESYRVVALAADGARVFVLTSGGRVVGLSAKDGKELWSRKLTTRVALSRGLFVVGGKVWAVAESPAGVFALDAGTGEPRGQIELGLAQLGVKLPRVTDEPAFAPKAATLYLVVDDRTVYALDLRAGRLRWRVAVEFGIGRVLATADGQACYVVPEEYVHNAQILSLDPASGRVVRRRSLLAGSLVDAALGGGMLVVARRNNDGDTVVEALDGASLKARWRSVPLRLFRPSPLALGDGYVAVVGRAGHWQQAVVLDASSGKVTGEVRPLGAGFATVAFVGRRLLVCTDRGIFAYGAQERSATEREVVDLVGRWRGGDRSALAPLARALCRLGQHDRAIAILDAALRDESLGEADYARLKDALNSAREALAARRPALLRCARMPVPPNIDGAIDEPWRREDAAYLDGPAHVEEIQGTPWKLARWRSPADLSAVLYTGWDSRYFYFAIDLSDDVHRTYTSYSDNWVGDGLIIAIDADNDGGFGYRFGSNDQLLTLALTRKDERRDNQDEEPSGEYRVRLKEDNSGAVYEVAIPWSFLGISNPRPGLRFGFNITITDDDSDRAVKALSWTPGMILDRDKMLMIRGFTPAYFGDILLTGPEAGGGALLEPHVAPRGKGVRVRRVYPRKEK